MATLGRRPMLRLRAASMRCFSSSAQGPPIIFDRRMKRLQKVTLATLFTSLATLGVMIAFSGYRSFQPVLCGIRLPSRRGHAKVHVCVHESMAGTVVYIRRAPPADPTPFVGQVAARTTERLHDMTRTFPRTLDLGANTGCRS